jgi:hypothetical protein
LKRGMKKDEIIHLTAEGDDKRGDLVGERD